ncbi:uncharacterized protein LOC115697746 [Cannabis sativa]|uniref:uncharacterized protein LOC115697746 n=1 Tax=Cannabis sativa TaxID=3483 RepID=UPI0029CA901C|nr:uncharacterized protein LOC115697746 [Cannabis sativa]
MREMQNAVRSNSKPLSASAIPKFKKNTAKNLDAEFQAFDLGSEQSSIETLDLSPISEISLDGEILKPMLPDPAFSASSVTSQLTTQPSDNTITSENLKQAQTPSSHGGFHEILNSKPSSSLEAEITISFLRKTKTQLLSLSEFDPHSKKLLDTMVEMVIDMILQTQTEEKKDIIGELISAKTTRIVYVCVLLLVLVMVVIQSLLFNSSTSRNSFGKPSPPT